MLTKPFKQIILRLNSLIDRILYVDHLVACWNCALHIIDTVIVGAMQPDRDLCGARPTAPFTVSLTIWQRIKQDETYRFQNRGFASSVGSGNEIDTFFELDCGRGGTI